MADSRGVMATCQDETDWDYTDLLDVVCLYVDSLGEHDEKLREFMRAKRIEWGMKD